MICLTLVDPVRSNFSGAGIAEIIYSVTLSAAGWLGAEAAVFPVRFPARRFIYITSPIAHSNNCHHSNNPHNPLNIVAISPPTMNPTNYAVIQGWYLPDPTTLSPIALEVFQKYTDLPTDSILPHILAMVSPPTPHRATPHQLNPPL